MASMRNGSGKRISGRVPFGDVAIVHRPRSGGAAGCRIEPKNPPAARATGAATGAAAAVGARECFDGLDEGPLSRLAAGYLLDEGPPEVGGVRPHDCHAPLISPDLP